MGPKTGSGTMSVLKTAVGALALCAGLLTADDAQAGGFTPWGSGTGANKIALSPYFFVGPDGTTTLAPYVFFGAGDYFDVMVGYGIGLDPQEKNPAVPGRIELMPRATIRPEAVIALHALYAPGAKDATLGLEFHGVTVGKQVAFTYNTGWWPTIGGADGFAPGTWFAILVPEFLVNERFSVFAEFNPNVSLADGTFGAQVVPGVTFYVDPDLKHSLSAVGILNVAPQWSGATFGLLYWTAFDTAKKGGGSGRHRPTNADAPALASADARTNLD